MIRDIVFALRAAFESGTAAWRDARGNPAIAYSFRAGDKVVIATSGISSKVVRRCWCDERYDLENGSTVPGYMLRRLE